MRERPVDAMLRSAAGRVSAHMPGHKGRAPFPCPDLYALDTTELPLTDNLWRPEGAVAEAERLYAEAVGAACSLMLTGGATAGVHAMLQLWAREGDTVILPRNAHLSAVNACVIGGLDPVWIPVRTTDDGWPYVDEANALSVMEAHPEAKTILLTRPDYGGCCVPLSRVADRARKLGMRLVVDEAHGGHLPWMRKPRSCQAWGADAWVQSAHKTLPALTGCAALHLRDRSDRSRALNLLTREQSSSPSYLLVRALDDARVWMEDHGRERLALITEAVDGLRARLPEMGLKDNHRLWSETGHDFDPTRLVISAPEGGCTLARALETAGIDAEMADDRRVVMIFTAMDEPQDIRAIGEALAALPHPPQEGVREPDPAPLPEKRMTPREAAMRPSSLLPLRQAGGHVSARAAGLYPPGVPLFMPGEIIGGEGLRQLIGAEDSRRFGTEGEMIECAL